MAFLLMHVSWSLWNIFDFLVVWASVGVLIAQLDIKFDTAAAIADMDAARSIATTVL
jgi:hypothetical protein